MRGALQFLEADALSAQILFAYEPVWAIGERGIPATTDYANKQHTLIKGVANDILPTAPRVLYGGSVPADNAAELAAQPDIDGLAIGRSAWQAEHFAQRLRSTDARR